MKTHLEKYYINYLLAKKPEQLFEILFKQQWYLDIQLRWAQSMNISEQMDVAEIGCGPGKLTAFVGKNSKSATGFDKNPNMINIARTKSRSKNIDFQILDMTDANATKLQTNKFDRIYGASILNVVKNKHQLINTCIELAKPGASIHFLFPTPEMNEAGVKTYAEQNNIKGFSLALLRTWQTKSPKMNIETAKDFFPKSLEGKLSSSSLMNGMIATVSSTL